MRSSMIALCIATAISTPALAQGRPTGLYKPVQVMAHPCFTPAETCTGEIVDQINQAGHTIYVQAYGFTSVPIVKALIEAKRRGVDVQAILDKSNDRTHTADGADKPVPHDDEGNDAPKRGRSRYSGATTLANFGIPVFIDNIPRIAHNKVIVIDGRMTIGGSFNYTTSAEKSNAENVTFIESPDYAEDFIANWQSRKAASRPYVAPSAMP